MATEIKLLVENDEELRGLLQLALPKVAQLAASEGGAAALVLALHCLMVKAGFTTLQDSCEGKERVGPSPYCPPPGWAARFKDEWVISYTRAGFASRFVLHCSLQVASLRMLVSVSEESNSINNEQLMGLQLGNYVPHPERFNSNDWTGIVVRARTMSELFQRHLVEPLLQHAEELPCSTVSDMAPALTQRTGVAAAYAWLTGATASATDGAAGLPVSYAAAAAVGVAVAITLYVRSSRRGGAL